MPRADSPGQRLGIEVYGRDAADARLLTKAGRFLLYRDSGPSLTITRLQQVEHEAYLTMRAGQLGVAVPEIAAAGTAGPSKDALLVYRLPAGIALSEADPADISDVTLDDLYRQLLILRRARIAHGAISGDALLVDPATADHRGDGLPQRHSERFAGSARSRPGRGYRGDGGGGRRRASRRRRGAVPHAGDARRRPAASAQAGAGPRARPEPARPARAAARCPAARRPGQVDRRAEAGRAAPGELADADHDHRIADRRLGPHRGAHRRLPVLRHRDRRRLALGRHGVRAGPAGLRGLSGRRHRQRARTASVRPGGGRRGRQGIQRAGRRDAGRLRHPGALLPATGLRRRRWR